MRIERITYDTIPSVVKLFDAYRQFYKQPGDKKAAEEFLMERITKGESVIFAAYEDEQPAGFVQLYPTFSSVAMQKMYILNDLFVAENFRKSGVGRKLMETIFAFCKEDKARSVILETAADNYSAQRLYEQLGMKLDGVKHYEMNFES
ncbi:GNAT family N-acetyltransferase [Alkalicoccus daliensis]|uniref:Ribosomal protein S18 acetylase RimI n=1 Tax=Alkalicoccus daliensis TaxID=745820 RepID=A0A1H0D8R3_9BACI|nr:GNAT family N-acetyltransferase [Alkalicoccus daliensis]SDN66459.1 Ribosomal protein S18 acetylase RimI [Alkalicoccus daliensis]